MPIKLLQHKSWHVYSAENIARVKRDEARAAAQDEEDEQRTMLADSEARLDRLRKKADVASGKKRKRDRDDEGEKELERQLKGKGRAAKDEEEQVRATIVRPDGGKSEKKEVPMTTNGHLNFWAELEAVRSIPCCSVDVVLTPTWVDRAGSQALPSSSRG